MNRPGDKIIDSLKGSLSGLKGPVTVADASVKTGLSLTDTKYGLNFLVFDYRGVLSATDEGELLYAFPTGFKKPWEQKERFERFLEKAKKTGLGVLKFLVRSWISIVMVGYVVIFALIVIALSFRNSDRDEGHSLSGSLMMHTLLRLVMDSLFWTFHPFSPFNVGRDPYYDGYRSQKKKTPFYEKVNQFFFGPEEKVVDEQELSKIALQEIRAQYGRIGILDLMRVTGLGKDEADQLMAKLMLNHDGDVVVSDDGGIVYEFPAMRKSALTEKIPSPPPIWLKYEKMPAFTGNQTGSNFLIAALNGFNLFMSTVAIANGWTIEKLKYLFTVMPKNIPPELLPPPPEGVPLLLGWIPFIFSIALFLIPAGRAIARGQKKQEIDAKNGRRGLIRAILSKLGLSGIKEDALRQGWTEQAKASINEKQFNREVIKLGGELELNDKDILVWRFKALESDIKALENARKRASKNETLVGEVVFSSAK